MTAPVIDSRNDSAGWSNADGGTITLTNAPSAGGIVVVAASVYSGGGGGTGFSCAATGGSGVSITERVDTVGATAGIVGVLMWTVEYSTAPTSLTIENTTSGGNTFGNATALNITGQNASYFDVAGSGSGTSTTPSATGMPDTTDAEALVIGVMTRAGTSGTIAAATNWTQVVEIDEANSVQTMNVVQRAPGSAGAFDPAWTISSSDDWVAGGISIKGTSGGTVAATGSAMTGGIGTQSPVFTIGL